MSAMACASRTPELSRSRPDRDGDSHHQHPPGAVGHGVRRTRSDHRHGSVHGLHHGDLGLRTLHFGASCLELGSAAERHLLERAPRSRHERPSWALELRQTCVGRTAQVCIEHRSGAPDLGMARAHEPLQTCDLDFSAQDVRLRAGARRVTRARRCNDLSRDSELLAQDPRH